MQTDQIWEWVRVSESEWALSSGKRFGDGGILAECLQWFPKVIVPWDKQNIFEN